MRGGHGGLDTEAGPGEELCAATKIGDLQAVERILASDAHLPVDAVDSRFILFCLILLEILAAGSLL